MHFWIEYNNSSLSIRYLAYVLKDYVQPHFIFLYKVQEVTCCPHALFPTLVGLRVQPGPKISHLTQELRSILLSRSSQPIFSHSINPLSGNLEHFILLFSSLVHKSDSSPSPQVTSLFLKERARESPQHRQWLFPLL